MISPKALTIAPIASRRANAFMRKVHYSGKVVNNSALHLGVFSENCLGGVMSFGPPSDKHKTLNLVADTKWDGMVELNRLAFIERLPRNSESRALGVALRMLRKSYPRLEWVLSFADGCQCGDGTIYRAAGFILTGIKQNNRLYRLPGGEVIHQLSLDTRKARAGGYGTRPEGAQRLDGFMLRYIYFINPFARNRLTVPELPYSEIKRRGASMYLGRAPVEGLSDQERKAVQTRPARSKPGA